MSVKLIFIGAKLENLENKFFKFLISVVNHTSENVKR